jgi:hypothetical protein
MLDISVASPHYSFLGTKIINIDPIKSPAEHNSGICLGPLVNTALIPLTLTLFVVSALNLVFRLSSAAVIRSLLIFFFALFFFRPPQYLYLFWPLSSLILALPLPLSLIFALPLLLSPRIDHIAFLSPDTSTSLLYLNIPLISPAGIPPVTLITAVLILSFLSFFHNSLRPIPLL